MPPSSTGLVPQRCEANDQTLQLLGFYQFLHIDWQPTELQQNLEKSEGKAFRGRPERTEQERRSLIVEVLPNKALLYLC